MSASWQADPRPSAPTAVEYTRGLITIVDRPRLQGHACSCHEATRRSTDAALAPRRPGTSGLTG